MCSCFEQEGVVGVQVLVLFALSQLGACELGINNGLVTTVKKWSEQLHGRGKIKSREQIVLNGYQICEFLQKWFLVAVHRQAR